jgi:large subunit ribosomal protein L3
LTAVLGLKVNMTQVYDDQGMAVPATAIDVSECVVARMRTKGRDGYEAVQLGFGKANAKRLSKPRAGYFKQAGIEPVRFLREVRTESAVELKVGQKLGAELFQAGDKVVVFGNTKGRGFAGGMKRWGWHGGKATHGSTSHRRIGSVGAGTSPGRVLPGRTLPGQYGNERVMVRNLKVVKVEPEKGLLYIKGAVPGNRGSLLLVKKI